MSDLPNLDPAAMERLQRLGGDAFVAKMIALFLEYAGSKVTEARAAQQAGDWAAVAKAVHPIKSSAGNVGAAQVQDLAKRIEEFAREGQSGEATPLLDKLELAFAAVKVELERRLAS